MSRKHSRLHDPVRKHLSDLLKPACLAVGVGLGAGSQQATGGDELPGTPDEIQDSWSSIFYCQAIYQEPTVKDRIYAGDLQSCQKADSLIRWLVSRRYSPPDRQILEQNARNKSGAIRYNTRSVQEAIMACRQQCRQYAAIFDRKLESGEITPADD